MQNTSSLYRQIFAEDNRYFETKVDINGVEYGEDVIFSLSTDTQMFENNPEVGKAVAGEIDLSILKPNVTIPNMARIKPYVRVCVDKEVPSDATMAGDVAVNFGEMDGDTLVLDDSAFALRDIVYFGSATEHLTSEWIQKGVYYIDTRETTHNDDDLDILTIHGFDAMLFAEQGYPSTDHEWPIIDTEAVEEIAATMGVDVDERTWDIMTDENVIQLPDAYSLRETLGFIASMYVGSWVMTDIGELRLITLTELPPETNYLVDMLGYAILFGEDRILV